VPKSARDITAGLTKKGFVTRPGDHIFFHLLVDGRKTIVNTKISRGAKEVDDRLLGVMARQVRLNRRQFLDLIDCPLAFDDYVRILRASGAVPAGEEDP
jgi:hypothetical protein